MWKMKRMQLVFSLIWMHILLHLKREIKKGKKEEKDTSWLWKGIIFASFPPFLHHIKQYVLYASL